MWEVVDEFVDKLLGKRFHGSRVGVVFSEAPHRSCPMMGVIWVMPFKNRISRHPAVAQRTTTACSLSNCPGNMGKYQFCMQVPVCDSPTLPSDLHKNPSLTTGQCSGQSDFRLEHPLSKSIKWRGDIEGS
jgi:hypothetical protein